MQQNSDAAIVLASAARLIQEARIWMPWYAGDFAPIRTDQTAELLQRFACYLVVQPIDGEAVGMVLPRCRGLHALVVEKDCARTERAFVVRHELAHVIRGDVGEEPLYLVNGEAMGHAERAADLFGLADLIPGWMLGDLRRAKMRKDEILDELRYACREFASLDWSDERVEDRAVLRYRLWREWGI